VLFSDGIDLRSPEFLVVELLNRLDELAEDRDRVVQQLKVKLSNFNRRKFLYAASHYGALSTQKKLEALMASAGSEVI
jgi:hypothetical protein